MTSISETQYSFALCLTHDVDRPFKTPFHALFYGALERSPSHLAALREDVNPYWQFETLMDLESELGVRSAFYFLNEPPVSSQQLTDLLEYDALVQAFGRYTVRNPDIAEIVRELDAGGWEVGLHGSYHTPTDLQRLRTEKDRIEDVLGSSITGGRQHYLNLEVPDTWQHYRSLGLQYDATLGSRRDCGFFYGYDVLRPFDDEFVVFPVTLMEQHLPDPGADLDAAWATCESLLDRADEEDAVMSVLFHPRYFNENEFPGYQRIYRRLVRAATDRGAWVGSPGAYYDSILGEQARVAAPN
jgi:peptidoglycan/xylan/chitin deacetylase (PgdA/CDA1 family)